MKIIYLLLVVPVIAVMFGIFFFQIVRFRSFQKADLWMQSLIDS